MKKSDFSAMIILLVLSFVIRISIQHCSVHVHHLIADVLDPSHHQFFQHRAHLISAPSPDLLRVISKTNARFQYSLSLLDSHIDFLVFFQ